MSPEEICISFIVAILGIAYPILLEVISGLDDKYSSTLIIDLFNKEVVKKIFKVSLIASPIAILLWILQLPVLIHISCLNRLLKNSASGILFLITFFLILWFFLFIERILIYYTPRKFLPYLIKKHLSDLKVEENNFEVFRGIGDVFYFSIRKQYEDIARTAVEFFYTEFKKIRERNGSNEVKYPDAYYRLIYQSIEELAERKHRKMEFLVDHTVGSIWLIGELVDTRISQLTYNWMWRNLLLALSFDREDFVFRHWQQAHQHFIYHLKNVPFEWTPASKSASIENEKDVEQRKEEQKYFLEFHYALCALLLFQKRYSCLRKIFTYTTSIPPRFELLPDSMDTIFPLFFDFADPYNFKSDFIAHKYPFPDMEGLMADYQISDAIADYFALLFVRQYMLTATMGYMPEPTAYPSLPSTQPERKRWINNIDEFKKSVNDKLSDSELLKSLNFDAITEAWCKENKKVYPLPFFDNLKKLLINEYEAAKLSSDISEEKVEKFLEYSRDKIKRTLEKLAPLNNADPISTPSDKYYVEGIMYPIERSAFAADPETTHMNFHSFLAQSLSKRLKFAITTSFYRNRYISYLLQEDDILPALQKIGVNSDYIIIGFGLNLNSINPNTELQLPGEFVYLAGEVDILNDSLFVLKKTDLPRLTFLDTKKRDKEFFKLKILDEKYQLYSNVIGLSENVDLIEKLEPQYPDKNLRQSVLISLFINLQIEWKKNCRCIQIRRHSIYRENGIVQKLSDVETFK